MNRRGFFKRCLGGVAGWAAINKDAEPKQTPRYRPGKWECRIVTTNNGVTTCRYFDDEGRLAEEIIK